MPERDIVNIKFPLYLGEKREREVRGEMTLTEPFVEMWKYFRVSTQQMLKVRPRVYLGLRMADQSEYVAVTPLASPDPIRLYRALKILDRFSVIHDPTNQATEAFEGAGFNYPLNRHHGIQSKFRNLMGNEGYSEILQAIPPNLQHVVENLRKNRVSLDGSTLQREVTRGRIETNPLYERVIQQTKKQRSKNRFIREGLFEGTISILTL